MPRRRVPRLVVAFVVATLALLAGAPVAAAHGDDGTMTVITLQPVGPDQVRLEVGITYTNDGDLAEDAQVDAVLRSGNVTVGPEQLARVSGGRYGADITVPGPGAWAVSVTSTNPDAEATDAVTVDAPTTTAAPTTTTSVAPTTTETPTTTTEPAQDGEASDDGDSSLPLVIALVAGGLVLLAGVAVVVLRSGREDDDDAEVDTGPPGDGPTGEGPTGDEVGPRA